MVQLVGGLGGPEHRCHFNPPAQDPTTIMKAMFSLLLDARPGTEAYSRPATLKLRKGAIHDGDSISKS